MKALTPGGVRRLFNKLYKRQKELNASCGTQQQHLDVIAQRIRERCPHAWDYHPDPSGNNDSYYSCSLCGAERQRLRGLERP